jgi:hypothetical protein
MSFVWGRAVETHNQREMCSFVVAIVKGPTPSADLPTLSNDATTPDSATPQGVLRGDSPLILQEKRRSELAFDQSQFVKCPNCGYLIENWNTIIPVIDACGFESYSLRCKECEAQLGGIIDAEDGQLLLVKLEGSIRSSSPP